MKLTVREAGEWTALFQRNAGTRDFGSEERALTDGERSAITASIQEFQLGESGEGSHIMRQAKVHAARSWDAEYLVALRLFIAEEIRHSRELKAFMESQGIATIQKTAADSAFRCVRRMAGLELTIAVLVGAEIVAKVYYLGLARATGSAVLQRICRQILVDEVDHVTFQTERLAILRQGMGPAALLWRNGVYSVFFRCVLVLIWMKHGRALRAGGYSFGRYYRHSIVELGAAMKTMDPRNYRWPERERRRSFVGGRVASVRCACAGISHLVRTQKNAHVHLAATVVVIAVGIGLRVGAGEWCWLTVALALVWTAEALNTALEFLCDATHPGPHELVGKAKDVAAAGVLMAAMASAAIGAMILTPHLMR